MSSYRINDELYHYGILGQKWGIRRYQNEDGTLTEAGRARYEKKETKRQASVERGKELLGRDQTVGKSVGKTIAKTAAIAATCAVGIAITNAIVKSNQDVFVEDLLRKNPYKTSFGAIEFGEYFRIANRGKRFTGRILVAGTGLTVATIAKGVKDSKDIGNAKKAGHKRFRERYYNNSISHSESLYHHGVLGQKWGERNGPPYPLSDKSHSGREKLAGWKRSLASEDGEGGLHLTDRQKKMLVIGAAAITGAAYMQYRYNSIASLGTTLENLSYLDVQGAMLEIEHNYSKKGRGNSEITTFKTKIAIDDRARTGTVDSKTGLYVNSNPGSIEENCRKVNPDFNPDNPNTSQNCGLCSITYDMRRRGYDVYAGQGNTGISRGDIIECYRGVKPVRRAGNYGSAFSMRDAALTHSEALKVVDSFKREKSTRGIMTVSWMFGSGGHAISYEVDANGILTIVDSQPGKIYKGDEAVRYLMQASSVESFRTDNARPNIKWMKEKNLIV